MSDVQRHRFLIICTEIKSSTLTDCLKYFYSALIEINVKWAMADYNCFEDKYRNHLKTIRKYIILKN